jgi:hypothetical protein
MQEQQETPHHHFSQGVSFLSAFLVLFALQLFHNLSLLSSCMLDVSF